MTYENTTIRGLSVDDVQRPVIVVLDGKAIGGVLDTIWVATRRPFGIFKEKKPEVYVVKVAITVGDATVEIDKPDLNYIIQIDRDEASHSRPEEDTK